jgi:Domain of unknown function (DUF2431)
MDDVSTNYVASDLHFQSILDMARILLLGEGDFSFAYDLCQVISQVDTRSDIASVVATSFDVRTDLLQKYSSVEKHLDRLSRSCKFQVIHGIDATKSLKTQFTDANCQSLVFDHVVFNFPHLGYEDMKVHSSLLAHIIHRFYICTITCIFQLLKILKVYCECKISD